MMDLLLDEHKDLVGDHVREINSVLENLQTSACETVSEELTTKTKRDGITGT